MFRVYLDQQNKRRDKDQGVCIDPESTVSRLGVDSDQNAALVDETGWENKNYRYYVWFVCWLGGDWGNRLRDSTCETE